MFIFYNNEILWFSLKSSMAKQIQKPGDIVCIKVHVMSHYTGIFFVIDLDRFRVHFKVSALSV